MIIAETKVSMKAISFKKIVQNNKKWFDKNFDKFLELKN